VIVGPETKAQHDWLRYLFKEKGNIHLTGDAHILAWLREFQPAWLVAYDGWLGTTCQMHMLGLQPYVPKALRFAAFNYAFNRIGRTRVFGVVNSHNVRALRFDRWLGFKDLVTVPGCHDDGGDLVILTMTAEDWRNGQELFPSSTRLRHRSDTAGRGEQGHSDRASEPEQPEYDHALRAVDLLGTE
jgi:hypothetical protein